MSAIKEGGKEEVSIDPDERRLWYATIEQAKIGPKGLPSDATFDTSQWENWDRKFIRGMISVADFYTLPWCRIHLSVATVTSDIALVHYSFENLYDGELPLNIDNQLFSLSCGIDRKWLKAEENEGQAIVSYLPTAGISILHSVNPVPMWYVEPFEILTFSVKVFRDKNGVWPLSRFGDCLPGSTYKLQLIDGGLPSNVFTWTAPD